MILGGVLVLALLDSVLLFYIFFRRGRSTEKNDLLLELHEERSMSEDLLKKMEAMMSRFQESYQKAMGEMQKMAGEVEQESKNIKTMIKMGLKESSDEIAATLNKPMMDLQTQKTQLEVVMRKADREKESLTKSLKRIERLVELLKKDLPYDDIIDQWDQEKMEDARYLLAQGRLPEDIAHELNLPLQDVRMMAFARP